MREEAHFFSIEGKTLRGVRYEPAKKNPAPDVPVLVFLHEALGSVGQWKDFPFVLCERTALAGLSFDRLGHGRSDDYEGSWPPDYLEREAHYVLPSVLDQAGIGRALLVGHSDGGSIALLFAARFSDRVAAVITEAAHVFVEDTTLRGIEETVEVYETTDLPNRLARYHGEKTGALFYRWADRWRGADFRLWNMQSRLPRIASPVLVIQGAEDEYGTARQVESIAAGCSGRAEIFFVPRCGHAPHRQARNEVLAAMEAFIASAIQAP
ncbi:MAG: alpha/beta hydrolase [Deltaproteobacteria bacterium]|nr:alpha/beta hydrolase [Deltaproteobacteria bacterium]